jgi:hypothetical protein
MMQMAAMIDFQTMVFPSRFRKHLNGKLRLGAPSNAHSDPGRVHAEAGAEIGKGNQ